MHQDEISAKVKECIKKVKGNHFKYTEQLISGGYFNSFDFFELIVILEKDLEIKFPLNDIKAENFDNIDSIIGQIKKAKEAIRI